MNSPHPSSEELFHRLLDESSALLAAPESAGITIPDDELHREIIVPLLPAMLGDKAIRGHWIEQHATGFPARIARHFENGDPAPRWTPGDFEIHVTASYSAGADARALADTLLSEDSLCEMTAALMNQLLDALWPSLAPAPAAPEPAIEIQPMEIPAAEIPAPEISTSAEVPAAEETQLAEFQVTPRHPSRALVRSLCGKLGAAALRQGIAANSTQPPASAAIIARRIISRTAHASTTRRTPATRGFPSRAARPGCR